MRRDWLKFLALMVPVLTGCLSHTRSLQKPIMAGTVLNADAVQLVEAVNRRYDQVNSLTATVDFAASVGGAHTGKETDYTSFHGYILFRKPQMLRVIGLLPVVRTHAFDLASNGQTFTMVIPHYNKAIEGSNAVTTRAKNPFENLRPDVFLDSILIRSINPDWIVSLTHSTKLEPQTKQLIETPQYDLTVLKPGSRSSSPLCRKWTSRCGSYTSAASTSCPLSRTFITPTAIWRPRSFTDPIKTSMEPSSLAPSPSTG